MDILTPYLENGRAYLYPGAAQPDSPQADEPGVHHTLSRHPPLWAFLNPNLLKARLDRPGPPFTLLPAGCSVQEASRHTRTLIFVGAAPSPELAWARAQAGLAVFVFEPDPERFRTYLAQHPTTEPDDDTCFFILGDLNAPNSAPLSMVLDNVFEKIDFPAFFVREGLERTHRTYLAEVIRQTEVLFYRGHLYQLEGQWLARSVPVREITRELFYDQVFNLYENLTKFLVCGNLEALRGCLSGTSAILVGGSPDLDQRIESIRRWKNRAVVIAVNRALPALHAAGIEPHFAVVNDNSLTARELMNSLPRFANTILACHSLSPTGGNSFGRTMFFANALEHIFGERPWLPLHGSVITTAFSLARFLGCVRCVIVGGQLSSHDPLRLSYAKGLTPDASGSPAHWEPHHPYLVAVKTPSGETLYTSANFLDSATWFRDEIRLSAIEVINLAKDSVLFGPPIIQDEHYEPPAGPDVNSLVAALHMCRAPVSAAALIEYIRKEIQHRRSTMLNARALLRTLHAPGDLARFATLLRKFDQDNTTYLLERFPAFQNRQFHSRYFDGADPEQRLEGARYYLTHVLDMAQILLRILEEQLKKLAGMTPDAQGRL